MSDNWTEFKLRVNTKASVEKAYAAVATPAGLESWFLRRADITVGNSAGAAGAGGAAGSLRQPGDKIQKGDEYEFRWHGYPDSTSHKGKILAVDGKSQFSFTFSQELPVSISVYKECDETIVELVEMFDPADQEASKKHYLGNMKGWIFYLINLKSVLEGGLDMRNRKEELQNVLTA
jgi:uncharacterized protein YndB with AHSA1/START domain